MRSLLAFARRLAGVFKHRREAKILAGLDAHMLADIGLNRADLRDAFSEPLWRDPTRVLEMRAGQRRAHRRGIRTFVPARETINHPPADCPARLHL
jgi:uncharacterized protein YjiS (DUF1127 family)